MIAMALLTRPELLIADEPTTALDVSVQAQILQLLRELKQELNMGLLFITHNLSIVRQLADRVAVMQNGRCVEHNDCRALFSAPAHPYTQRLLDSEPDGEPVPLAADAPVLLQADDLKVAFPVRKGSCVGWSIIIGWSTALAFSCAPARRWAWWGNRVPVKYHRPGPAAPDPVRGQDNLRRPADSGP